MDAEIHHAAAARKRASWNHGLSGPVGVVEHEIDRVDVPELAACGSARRCEHRRGEAIGEIDREQAIGRPRRRDHRPRLARRFAPSGFWQNTAQPPPAPGSIARRAARSARRSLRRPARARAWPSSDSTTAASGASSRPVPPFPGGIADRYRSTAPVASMASIRGGRSSRRRGSPTRGFLPRSAMGHQRLHEAVRLVARRIERLADALERKDMGIERRRDRAGPRRPPPTASRSPRRHTAGSRSCAFTTSMPSQFQFCMFTWRGPSCDSRRRPACRRSPPVRRPGRAAIACRPPRSPARPAARR